MNTYEYEIYEVYKTLTKIAEMSSLAFRVSKMFAARELTRVDLTFIVKIKELGNLHLNLYFYLYLYMTRVDRTFVQRNL